MEVPVVNRVGDLHHVIGRIPTMISRVLIEQVQFPEIISFWKWGAVIIAVYAIVNSVLVSFKIEFLRFRNRQSAVTKALLSYTTDDDYSSDEEEEDEDDDSVSSSSVNEDEYSEDDDGIVEKVKLGNDGVFGSLFDFRVFEKDNNEEVEDEDVACRFTWSNFANGKSVVKLWDGIGLGLDLNNASGSIVSIHNLNNPSVTLSAGKDVETSHRFLRIIDSRVSKQPVITNWRSASETGGKIRVVDLRKATEEEAAEWSSVTWLDADGDDADDVAGL